MAISLNKKKYSIIPKILFLGIIIGWFYFSQPVEAAVLTGTPTAVDWGTAQDPTGQAVTIPSDATAVYLFWNYWVSANGHGLQSATLNGASPNQTFEIATLDEEATGVAVWYNPPTGSQTMDVAWDIAPADGPESIVVFVKNGDTTAWRDADADQGITSEVVSVTLTTVSGDLVIKFDQVDGATPPSLSSGWTSGQTATQNGSSVRLSHIVASGSTQVADSENESNSTIVAVSIPDLASGAPPRKVKLFAGFKLAIVKSKLRIAKLEPWSPPAGGAPTVTTDSVAIDKDKATLGGDYWAILGGNITSIGGSAPTVRGFAWSTDSTLTSFVSTSTENGSFGTGGYIGFCADNVSSASPVTFYYRAYATNAQGTGFGTIESDTFVSNLVVDCGGGA